MLERFFKANSFGLHISNLKHVPGNTIFHVSKMIVWCLYVSWLCITPTYHGYVSWLCITYVSWPCAANPRMSIFEKCFKSCFDSGFRIYAKIRADSHRNQSLIHKTFLLFSWQNNRKLEFGPNVIYFALGITEGRPAGVFRTIKFYFEPEKRPAGAFWADYYVF